MMMAARRKSNRKLSYYHSSEVGSMPRSRILADTVKRSRKTDRHKAKALIKAERFELLSEREKRHPLFWTCGNGKCCVRQ